MKFTRQEELALIKLGLKQYLSSLIQQNKLHTKKKAAGGGNKWSQKRRNKHAAYMKKVWANKRKSNGKTV